MSLGRTDVGKQLPQQGQNMFIVGAAKDGEWLWAGGTKGGSFEGTFELCIER